MTQEKKISQAVKFSSPTRLGELACSYYKCKPVHRDSIVSLENNLKLVNDAVKFDIHILQCVVPEEFTNLKDANVEQSLCIGKEPPQNHDKGDDQQKS